MAISGSNRITGMFSGMDTDTLIKGLVAKQQNRIDKVSASLQKAKWKKEAYLETNNTIRKFRETFMSILSDKSNMLSKSSYSTRTASLVDESQSRFASVKTTSNATVGSYTLEVTQLASGAKVESAFKIGGSELPSTTKLKDINVSTGSGGYNAQSVGGKFEFSINGKDFSFLETDSIQKVIDTVNASSAGAKMSYSQLTGKFTVESTQVGADSKLEIVNKYGNLFGKNSLFGISGGDGPLVNSINGNSVGNISGDELLDTPITQLLELGGENEHGVNFLPKPGEDGLIGFKINGNVFNFAVKPGEMHENMTLKEMMKTINESPGLGAKMVYSENTNSFSFVSDSPANVTIENLSGNLFGTDASGDGSFFRIGSLDGTNTISSRDYQDNITITGGTNAMVKINGIEYTHTIKDDQGKNYSSNNFTLDGISYSLSKAAPGEEIVFNVSQNIDEAVDKIKGFITAYNELVTTLTSSYTQAVNKDYSPLTDEQREGMSDSEIEKWEKLAKEGLLKSDPALYRLLNDLRGAFTYAFESGDVSGSFSGLGLSTKAYNTNGPATIDLNENNMDKIRKALEENPDRVISMLTNVSTSTDSATKQKETGLIVRISDALNTFTEKMNDRRDPLTNTVIKGAINNETDRVTALEKEQKTANTKLQEAMTRLYKKYASLETMLSKAQGQSDWLVQQLSQ